MYTITLYRRNSLTDDIEQLVICSTINLNESIFRAILAQGWSTTIPED